MDKKWIKTIKKQGEFSKDINKPNTWMEYLREIGRMGEEIAVVFIKKNLHGIKVQRKGIGYVNGLGEWYVNGEDDILEVTHCMKLPDFPPLQEIEPKIDMEYLHEILKGLEERIKILEKRNDSI